MFSEQQLKVIEYCAEEVKRQGDTPNHVYSMLNAWNWASSPAWLTPDKFKIDLNFIETVGKLVDPIDNANGFRTIPIGVGNGFEWIEKAKPESIERLLTALIEAYYDGRLSPMEGYYVGLNEKSQSAEDEFYYQFENIHPFRDGNGRTGKVLYNYLKGTLDNPVWPPNFWDVSNP